MKTDFFSYCEKMTFFELSSRDGDTRQIQSCLVCFGVTVCFSPFVFTAAALTDHLSFTLCASLCAPAMTHLSSAFFLSLHQSTVPQPTFSMPVTMPVSNQNTAAAAALQFSNNPSGALVTTTSFVTSTLTDPRLLSPQQPALQRNTVSPGLPQRPASAGKRRRGRRSWAALVARVCGSVVCDIFSGNVQLERLRLGRNGGLRGKKTPQKLPQKKTERKRLESATHTV